MSDAVSNEEKINESNQDKDSKKSPSNVDIEVYKRYQQLAINEDRLLNERLMVFLTSNSILFLGYIMSFQVESESFPPSIRIILPVIGISLCVLCFLLVYPAKKAWEIWIYQLAEIEGKFKPCGLTVTPPSKEREETEKGPLCSGVWPWRVGCCFLPLIFLVLWSFSLYISLCQVFG